MISEIIKTKKSDQCRKKLGEILNHREEKGRIPKSVKEAIDDVVQKY